MTLFALLKQAAAAVFSNSEPPAESDRPVTVGTGADNEYQITIDGVPHLFRDEGDHVVHFVAEFDRQIQHTTFGNKVLPEVVPRWNKVRTHCGPNDTPQSVAEAVVRESKHSATPPEKPAKFDERKRSIEMPTTRAANHRTTPRMEEASSSTYTVGMLLEWGEMEFPNRKPNGKPTYKSFAVKLDTEAGVKTLQGEGLKDVLAETGCKAGERVGIKRLRKEKVPAFDHHSGRPIRDKATGEQMLWDRWVWAINRIH